MKTYHVKINGHRTLATTMPLLAASAAEAARSLFEKVEGVDTPDKISIEIMEEITEPDGKIPFLFHVHEINLAPLGEDTNSVTFDLMTIPQDASGWPIVCYHDRFACTSDPTQHGDGD